MLPTGKEIADIIVPIVDLELGSLNLGAVHRMNKADGSFVTEFDQRLQSTITTALKAKWPQFALLGEEMELEQQAALLDSSYAKESHGIWVLDPLDGTTNFSAGLPIFGISVALVVDGQSQVAMVYDPNRKECFHAEMGQGAWLNDRPLAPSVVTTMSDCIANVDYKRLTRDLASQLVICPPYRSQRNIGACVLEWCWLACDRIQLYLHGGQQLWDHAAGHLILHEAGGLAKTLQRDELKSHTLSKQSAVAAASPQLYGLWNEWVGMHSHD